MHNYVQVLSMRAVIVVFDKLSILKSLGTISSYHLHYPLHLQCKYHFQLCLGLQTQQSELANTLSSYFMDSLSAAENWLLGFLSSAP